MESSVILLAVCFSFLCATHSLSGFSLISIANIFLLISFFDADKEHLDIIQYFIVTIIITEFVIIYFKCNAIKVNAVKINHDKYIYSILLFTLLFSCYHLSVTGIPIFSDNFEQLRFENSSSGFFSIPSRVYIFFPILLGFYSVFFLITNRLVLSILCFILSFSLIAFQSSKSGMLFYFYLMLIIFPMLKLSYRKKMQIASAIIILAVTYFVAISSSYASISEYSLIEYVLERVTTIAYMPIRVILDNKSLHGIEIIITDILYMPLKLLGADVYTFNNNLSKYIYGTTDFTVPVTPGFIAYNYAAGGLGFVFLSQILFLMFFNSIYKSMLKGSSIHVKSVYGFCIYNMFVIYSTGNPYYWLINTVSAILLIFIIFVVSRIFCENTSSV